MKKLLFATLFFSAPATSLRLALLACYTGHAMGMNEEGMRQCLDTVTMIRDYFRPIRVAQQQNQILPPAVPEETITDATRLLLKAIAIGNSAAAEKALNEGADPNWQDSGGYTPFATLVLWGGLSTEVIQRLIEGGARINLQNNYGDTPLHLAARGGSVEWADVLVRYGADVQMKNNQDKTPIDIAHEKFGKYSETYKILYDAEKENERKTFRSRIKGIATEHSESSSFGIKNIPL